MIFFPVRIGLAVMGPQTGLTSARFQPRALAKRGLCLRHFLHGLPLALGLREHFGDFRERQNPLQPQRITACPNSAELFPVRLRSVWSVLLPYLCPSGIWRTIGLPTVPAQKHKSQRVEELWSDQHDLSIVPVSRTNRVFFTSPSNWSSQKKRTTWRFGADGTYRAANGVKAHAVANGGPWQSSKDRATAN